MRSKIRMRKRLGGSQIMLKDFRLLPDLPLNFHPATVRASTNVTPFGAVSVPA